MSEVAVFNQFKESLAELLDEVNRIFSGQISEKNIGCNSIRISFVYLTFCT